MVPSEKVELDGHLVAHADPRLASDLLLHRQEIAAALHREHRRAPGDAVRSDLDPRRLEAAHAREAMRADFVRLLLWHRDEVPSAVLAGPQAQRSRDRDHPSIFAVTGSLTSLRVISSAS